MSRFDEWIKIHDRHHCCDTPIGVYEVIGLEHGKIGAEMRILFDGKHEPIFASRSFNLQDAADFCNQHYKENYHLIDREEELCELQEGMYLVHAVPRDEDEGITNDVHMEEMDAVWYPALVLWAGDKREVQVMGWNWNSDYITTAHDYRIVNYKAVDCTNGTVHEVRYNVPYIIKCTQSENESPDTQAILKRWKEKIISS